MNIVIGGFVPEDFIVEVWCCHCSKRVTEWYAVDQFPYCKGCYTTLRQFGWTTVEWPHQLMMLPIVKPIELETGQ